jgi:hypothetical protein
MGASCAAVGEDDPQEGARLVGDGLDLDGGSIDNIEFAQDEQGLWWWWWRRDAGRHPDAAPPTFPDAAPRDAAAPDAAPRDAAPVFADAAPRDAAPVFADAAPRDAAAPDAAPRDASAPDAAPVFADAAPRDATAPPDSGAPDSGVSAGVCIDARLLFSEGFEGGSYTNFTSDFYDQDPSTCNSSAITTAQARSGTRSSRGVVTCAKTDGQSHRPYGGLQFNGDAPMAAYTNTGVGINAPFGIVTTFWGWLDAPTDFGSGRWFSYFTVNGTCDYSDQVVTLGLSTPQNSIDCAHVPGTGGQLFYAPNAPNMPERQWVRTTVYINYVRGEITTWMNGQKVFDGVFSRPVSTMCQFHWGLYASPSNANITYYEDDIAMYKLESALPNRTDEPYVGPRPLCP